MRKPIGDRLYSSGKGRSRRKTPLLLRTGAGIVPFIETSRDNARRKAGGSPLFDAVERRLFGKRPIGLMKCHYDSWKVGSCRNVFPAPCTTRKSESTKMNGKVALLFPHFPKYKGRRLKF